MSLYSVIPTIPSDVSEVRLKVHLKRWRSSWKKVFVPTDHGVAAAMASDMSAISMYYLPKPSKQGILSYSSRHRIMRGFVTCYLGLNSTFYPSLQHSDGASVAEDVFPLVVVAFSTQLRLANSSATAAPPPPTQSNKPRQFFTNFPCSRFYMCLHWSSGRLTLPWLA